MNNEFYKSIFNEEEKLLIVETKIENFFDRIFLLSVEEMVQYFGDSGQFGSGRKYINDEFNCARIATTADGTATWWFLRSSGDVDNLAICVGDDGAIYVSGHGINTIKAGVGGIRPAMWLYTKTE